MKKQRSTKKPSVADLLVSPLPTSSPNRTTSESPQQFEFNLNNNAAFNTTNNNYSNTGISNTKKKSNSAMQPTTPSVKSLSTISDLKELASSRLDSIKRQLDHSQSEIVKDIEASQSRLHKRLKIQTQACQQVMDEAEKEYKKMTERISESREAMKASYMDFITEAQASASRVCKTSIPELSQSFEKAIDAIQSRYGIGSTSV
ncbi:hypothetical protein LguiA_017789 [Lonicera macranthoides]